MYQSSGPARATSTTTTAATTTTITSSRTSKQHKGECLNRLVRETNGTCRCAQDLFILVHVQSKLTTQVTKETKHAMGKKTYAMSCRGRTAVTAVSGPLRGMTRGAGSSPSASLALSVMIITSAPRALTSSAAVLRKREEKKAR